ncbi:MAG TPA: adenylate/guanylate cyclase domain-containing protein [Spirochaetia bacterium]|nr:adenylate/guanylate cyclase domain-containing protein [Spirochaetales bacterium]HQK34125.1 adenylate/guanylate cyclase domain-containing protein [Spirochaetales bacterium]HRS64610.1 adenylate/guanylate cyclase domain-containing protein [Spirochaetia bacterium]HRV28718.1 adenylate/guanylate cyclase domain-containing protein [Spirochaetia bacterium]
MKTTKLAAVLFSRIADFDSLLNSNEQQALQILALYRGLLDSIIAEHEGTCFDKTGDEYLLIFSSSVHAVQFALHATLAVDTYNKNCSDTSKNFKLCIGIHLGEIWQEELHVYGNGINIAARVMQAAQPGMIVISEDVERQIANKLDIRCSRYQHETLKNIERPLVLYAINIKDEHTTLTNIIQKPSVQVDESTQLKASLRQDEKLVPPQRISRPPHDADSDELRDAIQNMVRNAINNSMLAMKYAEKYPENSVTVTDKAIELKNGNAVKKIKRKSKRPRNKPLMNTDEALQDELAVTRGTLIGAILKSLAALGAGAGLGYLYLSSKNWFWLAAAIIAGFFPTLSSLKAIRKSIEKIVHIKQELKADRRKK